MAKSDDMAVASFAQLMAEVRTCRNCSAHLPLGARPVLQLDPHAHILVAGQAPGRKVHESGIPFDDASGERLRAWTGLAPDIFYDARQVAILPMGFCYPGTGKSGDLPPRPECAPLWRTRLLAAAPNTKLTLVIGTYARGWHLPEYRGVALTDAIRQVATQEPHTILLPHPSPRNNIWLSKNPWFEAEILPNLRCRVAGVLSTGSK